MRLSVYVFGRRVLVVEVEDTSESGGSHGGNATDRIVKHFSRAWTRALFR